MIINRITKTISNTRILILYFNQNDLSIFHGPKRITNPFEGGARETLKCIRTGKDGISNGTDGLKALDLIFTIYRSAELKGKKLKLK